MKKSSKTIKRFIVGSIICTIALSQFAILKQVNKETVDKVVAGVRVGVNGKPGNVDPPIL